MKNSTKVSIITVCLNSAKTIEQTIQSVLNQTYQNIEYIIIDGQSIDGTLDIIDKYRQQIASCISEPDDGLYDAMNKGIHMTTGDIVGILNSDDWYDIQTVEKAVQIFSTNDVDVVYGDEMLLYEDEFMQRRVTGALADIVYRMNISHPTVFVKRKIYEKYGMFDTSYKIAADYDFLLRIYRQGVSMQECPGILAYFRMNGFSVKNGMLCADEARKVSIKHLTDGEKEQYLPLIEEEYSSRIKRFQIQSDMRVVQQYYNSKECRRYLSECYGKERKIYIFGAGSIGREVYEFAVKMGIEVEGFLDNNEKKIGTEYMGRHIYKSTAVKKENPFIIVAVLYHQEIIKQQLVAEGNVEDKDFKLYTDFVNDIKEHIYQDKEREN